MNTTMKSNYQALFCAFFLLAFFTLDSKGLPRVDHYGYRQANSTADQKAWNQPQANQYGGSVPTWNGGAQPTNNNNNQWNRYNPNQPTGSGNLNYNNNNFNNFNKTNQGQRYNNTPQAYPNNNFNQGYWSSQQPSRPFNSTNNWQRQNQNHLYPQLPQQNNWPSGRPGVQLATTPSTMSNSQWGNNYGNRNNPQSQLPNAGRPQNQNQGWLNQNNRTAWGVSTQPSNTNYWKGQQNYPNGYIQNQTVGSNSWNRPNTNPSTNNANTNGNASPNGWAGSSTNVGQPGLNSWNSGGGPSPGLNNWPNNGQTGWQGNTNNYNNNAANNPNNANNWRSSSGQENGGGSQGTSGVPLSPIGGNSNTGVGGQLSSASNHGIPLAPISGNNPSQPWNSGNSVQNQWSSNTNSGGSPQLAPLAPLSYGGGTVSQSGKSGNSNPYANMFN